MAAPISRLFVRYLQTSCRRASKESIRKSKGKSSSNQWLSRQINDPYVKRASEDGYRCRSAYKLLEINDKLQLIRPGSVVIDCGAAPGSWSQVAAERVFVSERNTKSQLEGKVIAVDLQSIHPIEGVTVFSNRDFTDLDTQIKIKEALKNRLADVVLSDMAPSASGSNELDHDIICKLCFSVLEFSSQVLGNGGHLVCKLWDGRDRDKINTVMKRMFREVKIVKPKASRSNSAEIFLVGINYFLKTP